MTEVNDPSAVARKRRKAIIQSQRSESEQLAEIAAPTEPLAIQENNNGNTIAAAEAGAAKPTKRKADTAEDSPTKQQPNVEGVDPPPSKKSKVSKKPLPVNGEDSDEDGKKKAQIRYDPEIPMSKEQLAAWRREARRVRNRESAAASRARIRSRITELEDEVGEWKSKYSQAMERLKTLDKPAGAQNNRV